MKGGEPERYIGDLEDENGYSTFILCRWMLIDRAAVNSSENGRLRLDQCGW